MFLHLILSFTWIDLESFQIETVNKAGIIKKGRATLAHWFGQRLHARSIFELLTLFTVRIKKV